MNTVAVYRGISFAFSERVAEMTCPVVPRVGETISLIGDDGPTSGKIAEVNHLFADESVEVRVRLAPTIRAE